MKISANTSLILSLFLLTAMLNSSLCLAQDNIPNDFKKTVHLLDNVRDYNLPYWEGFTLADKQVVLFNENSKTAAIWNADKSGKTKWCAKNSLPSEAVSSYFYKGKLNGIDTIFVAYDNPESTFRLVVHEGYHFYGQDFLKSIPVEIDSLRGTTFPENTELRYLMRAAYSSLKKKMDGKKEQGDREALYFYEKALRDYPVALKGDLNTSLAEGTATFAEYLFLAVAHNPDLKDDPVAAAKTAYALNQEQAEEYDFDKGFEYYQISALPLFYMAQQGRMELLGKIEEGTHPLGLLKHMVSPRKAAELDDLKKDIKDYYSAKNRNIKKHITTYLKKMNFSDYVEIRIKQSIFQGAMEFEEFVNFKTAAGFKTLNIATSAVAGSAGGGRIELNEINTANSANQQYFSMYIPKKDTRVEGNKLNVDSEKLYIQNALIKVKGNTIIIDK